MIGMPSEQFGNGQTVLLELFFQHQERGHQAQSQTALGPADAFGGSKLAGFGEYLQTGLYCAGPIKPVLMEEALPASAPGFDQGCRSGKGFDESPGIIGCPVIKGLEGCWIVLA